MLLGPGGSIERFWVIAGSAFDVGGFQFDSYVFRVTVGSAAASAILCDFIFLKILAFFVLRGPPAQG